MKKEFNIGDIVWLIGEDHEIYKMKVVSIHQTIERYATSTEIDTDYWCESVDMKGEYEFNSSDYGKIIFDTKEEATEYLERTVGHVEKHLVTKKLKDFTYDELRRACKKRPQCRGCPLLDKKNALRLCDFQSCFSNIDESLDEEFTLEV